MTPLASFAAQVLLWNPGELPLNPEQWSNGLSVTLWSNGTVSATPYGDNDGMTLFLEVFYQAGRPYFHFPFTIEGF